MARRALVTVLALAGCVAGGTEDVPPLSEQAALTLLSPAASRVLDTSRAPEMLRQCSRPTPTEVEGYWTPDLALTRALDRQLATAVWNALHVTPDHEGQRSRLLSSGYNRQYVGIVERNRRLVYVNAASAYRDTVLERMMIEMARESVQHGFVAESLASREIERIASGEWRWPASVCDGGQYYFGAVYDPETDRLEQLCFNGPGTMCHRPRPVTYQLTQGPAR